MKHKYAEEDFLTRWIANELTADELAEFENSEVLKQIDIINREASLLQGPVIDTEAALKRVTNQLKNSRPQVKKPIFWRYAAAASVAVLMGFLVFQFSTKTYETGLGEKQLVTLPDGSTIHLNVNSSVTHKRFGWLGNKEVDVQGEVYFEIVKGEGFKVNTSKGQVKVLGTEFNIRDRKSFEIQCFGGRIQFTGFTTDSKPKILEKDDLLRWEESELRITKFNGNQSNWRDGVSIFDNQPLTEVLEALEQYYNVSIDSKGIMLDRYFTGQFVHDNLETALKTTLSPMGLSYEIFDDGKLIRLAED